VVRLYRENTSVVRENRAFLLENGPGPEYNRCVLLKGCLVEKEKSFTDVDQANLPSGSLARLGFALLVTGIDRIQRPVGPDGAEESL
jgi:hypothetical protein